MIVSLKTNRIVCLFSPPCLSLNHIFVSLYVRHGSWQSVKEINNSEQTNLYLQYQLMGLLLQAGVT